jgi:hypothetical protein
VVPFGIEVETGATAFQLIPGIVRTTIFTGALQALLNENGLFRWSISPLARQWSFEDWRAGHKVTSFTFRLERPNPRYHGQIVEEIVDRLNLEAARLQGAAEMGDSVNTESQILQELLDHVRRRYGRGVLHGRDDRGEESEWRSEAGGTVPAQRRIPVQTEEREIPDNDLAAAIWQAPNDLLALPPGDVDDEAERT